MKRHIFGRLNDGSVHVFNEHVQVMRFGVPECRIVQGTLMESDSVEPVKSGDPRGESLTCNECKAILYGGAAADYAEGV